jgi:hypothetical protein
VAFVPIPELDVSRIDRPAVATAWASAPAGILVGDVKEPPSGVERPAAPDAPAPAEQAERVAASDEAPADVGRAGRLAQDALWFWPAAAMLLVAAVGAVGGAMAAIATAAAVIAIAGGLVSRAMRSTLGLVISLIGALLVLGGLAIRVDAEADRGPPRPSSRSLWGIAVEGRNFRGADLRGKAMQGTEASGANFRGADLTRARLDGARLVDADLRGADLTGACLRGAYLTEARLAGATLTGWDTTGATLPTPPADAVGWNSAPSPDACASVGDRRQAAAPR